MQSKDTRREGIHTCEHVHGDTTQAAANRLTLMLAEKPIADSDAAGTLSLAGKIDGTHAKKEKTAPKGERRMYLLLGQGPDSRGALQPDLQL